MLYSKDFDNNINEIFSGEISQDPSIYVYAPSVEDQSLAPEGQNRYLCADARFRIENR